MIGDHQQFRVTPLKRSARFQVLELISVLLVFMGVVGARVTQRMVFVAVPLSGSILLNLRNRRELDQLCHAYAVQGMNKIQTLIRRDLDALCHYLSSRRQKSQEAHLFLLQEHVAVLRDKVELLDANLDASAHSQQFRQLQTTLEALTEQAHHSSQDLSYLLQKQRLSAFSSDDGWTDPRNLNYRHQSDSTGLNAFQVWLAEQSILKGKVQALAAQVAENDQHTPHRLINLDRIEQFRGQLSELCHQVEQCRAEYDTQIQSLHDAQYHLQQDLQQLQEQLAHIQATVNCSPPSLKLSVQDGVDTIEDCLSPLWVKYVVLDNQVQLINFEYGVAEYQSRQMLLLRKQMVVIYQHIQQMKSVV